MKTFVNSIQLFSTQKILFTGNDLVSSRGDFYFYKRELSLKV